MFVYMYETELGRTWAFCKTLNEAQQHADNLACMGCSVAVFEYDTDTEECIELYTL